MINVQFITLVFLIFFNSICFADAPLAPAKAYTTCSTSKEYCIDFNFTPPKGSGVAYKLENHKKKEIWKIDNWMRIAYISNDGEYLVSCATNLVSSSTLWSAMDSKIVHIYKNGQLINQIKIKDIIKNKKMLVQTTSHYAWGHCSDLVDYNLTIIALNDKKIIIDITKPKSHEEPESATKLFFPWQQVN